jgi:hypothetical protein
MRITLPPWLSSGGLRGLLRSWPQSACEVELHFNTRQWATPTGMVGLACLIEKLRREGGAISIELNNCDTAGYWERMGFFRAVGLEPPYCAPVNPRPGMGRYAEIRKVSDIECVDTLTRELVAASQPEVGISNTFSHILSEAMNNVCQHSGVFGFSAAQYWAKNGRVELCIADSGCGLRSALSPRYAPANDSDAIRLALKVGVTSNSPNFGQSLMRNRGVGLSCIDRLVQANGGKFEIWSGRGRFVNGDGHNHLSVTQNRWTGTLLTVNMMRDKLTANFQAVMQELTAELRSVEKQSRG